MIGLLPRQLTINGKSYEIRSDYRDCLLIMQAYADPDLNDVSKNMVMLDILYKDDIPDEDIEEALLQGIKFLDFNKDCDTNKPNTKPEPPTYNWEQDEQYIFASINRVAGREVRLDSYLHWWTFLGYFNEIGEGVFATIVSIRSKKNRHKKLDDAEKEFYKRNKNIVDLKNNLSTEEQESRKNDLLALDELLGKG